LVETHFNVQRRLYDCQFSLAHTSADLEQRHQAFIQTYNTTAHQGLLRWHDYPARFTCGAYFQGRVMIRTFTVEELETLPPLHEAGKHPDVMIRRQVIVSLELPPLLKVANRVEVMFRGCAPEPITELRQAT
jgi:hypothetical protein